MTSVFSQIEVTKLGSNVGFRWFFLWEWQRPPIQFPRIRLINTEGEGGNDLEHRFKFSFVREAIATSLMVVRRSRDKCSHFVLYSSSANWTERELWCTVQATTDVTTWLKYGVFGIVQTYWTSKRVIWSDWNKKNDCISSNLKRLRRGQQWCVVRRPLLL